MSAVRGRSSLMWYVGLGLATGAGAALAACTDPSQGAVEVSWSLQVPAGAGVSCEEALVESMRLYWRVDGAVAFKAWPCERAHAVTTFEVPVGSAELWMEPACANGQAAAEGTFFAPAPLVRDIAAGEVVRIDAVVVQLVTPTNESPTTFCAENTCVCR